MVFGGWEKHASDRSGYLVGIQDIIFFDMNLLVSIFKMLHNFELISDYLNIFTSYMCFKDMSMAG